MKSISEIGKTSRFPRVIQRASTSRRGGSGCLGVGRGTCSRYAPSDVGRTIQLHPSPPLNHRRTGVSGHPSEQSERTSHVYTEVKAGGDPRQARTGVSPNRMLGRKDGFTLLEVLVAFVLLATTVTIILQLFSSNIKALSLSEDYASAVVRVESKMREVLDNEQLSEKAWSETSPEGYRFDITVAPAYEARTKDLPLKIMEIGVTMSWKKGGKEKSLTLNTMKAVKPQV